MSTSRKPSDKQILMLRAFDEYGENAAAETSDDFESPLWFHNRERCINAIRKRGWIDDKCELTVAGRAALARAGA